MADAGDLENYFRGGGLGACSNTMGVEVETIFTTTNKRTNLLSFRQSQQMFEGMCKRGWVPQRTDCGKIMELTDSMGNSVKYDAGHANLEIASAPRPTPSAVFELVRRPLGELYLEAKCVGADALRGPIVKSRADTLIDFTERDRSWIALDGRNVFAQIARIASFQMTIAVPLERAIDTVNLLHEKIDIFRKRFPQDRVWRTYVERSAAGYLPNRFGGPTRFESLRHYCEELAKHQVIDISTQRLVPFSEVNKRSLDVNMFLRSVWWYFRLRRYGNQLCIEIRPNGRYCDEKLVEHLMEICRLVQHPSVLH